MGNTQPDRSTVIVGDTGLGGEYFVRISHSQHEELVSVEDINGDPLVSWPTGVSETIAEIRAMGCDFSLRNLNGLISSIILSSDYCGTGWTDEPPYVATGVHAIEREWSIDGGLVSTVHMHPPEGVLSYVKFTDFTTLGEDNLTIESKGLTPAGLCAILDSRTTGTVRDQIIDEVKGMRAWG